MNMFSRSILAVLLLGTLTAPAAMAENFVGKTIPPQPTACLTTHFAHSGSQYWQNMQLTVTNDCGEPVDMSDSLIRFDTSNNINTVWGTFDPLTYPQMHIVSQQSPFGLQLTFAKWSANSYMLPPDASFTIKWGAEKVGFNAKSAQVFTNYQPNDDGFIKLTNTTSKPNDLAPAPWVVIENNQGQTVKKVQVGWQASKTEQLPVGKYSISPQTLQIDSTTYEGTATPEQVTAAKGKTETVAISYHAKQQQAAITIAVIKPKQLVGSVDNPVVTLINTVNHNNQQHTVQWDQTNTIGNLQANVGYQLSTPIITSGYEKCTPSFSPNPVQASEPATPVTLSYQCQPVAMTNVNISTSGLANASNIDKIEAIFTPTGQYPSVSQTIDLTGGDGSAQVQLMTGEPYNIGATNVPQYSTTITPSTITPGPSQQAVAIKYQQGVISHKRVIGYLPAWKALPSASELKQAGYTHILVAFGLFSTTEPGKISTIAIPSVTPAYIQQLHDQGIKVLLSIGGASTNNPGTTVDFNQVLTAAPTPAIFATTMVQSIENIMQSYGFDGVDIDIEHGLNPSGTFDNPTGDIQVMATIIKQLRQNNPTMLITMAPQVANVAPSQSFTGQWDNYAALIQQVAPDLTWVGIQLYNTGCAYGIDRVCHANPGNTPDFSVAMATGLMVPWPSTVNGQPTYFNKFTNVLKPDQVVLGYPAPDNTGASDGQPATPTNVIKQAVQCLITGDQGCGSYQPPQAFGAIGGVFDWEVTYDQKNNYQWAKAMKSCVIDGNC